MTLVSAALDRNTIAVAGIRCAAALTRLVVQAEGAGAQAAGVSDGRKLALQQHLWHMAGSVILVYILTLGAGMQQ